MLWKRAWIPRRSRSQGGATEQGVRAEPAEQVAKAEQGTRAEEAELKTTKLALKTKVEPAELKNTVLVDLETTVGLVEQRVQRVRGWP